MLLIFPVWDEYKTWLSCLSKLFIYLIFCSSFILLNLFRCNVSLPYMVVYKLYVYDILFTTLFNDGEAKSNFQIRAQHIMSPPRSFCPLNRKRICLSTLITMASTEVSCTFYCRLFPHVSIAASVTLSVCLWNWRLHKWLVFGINSCHQIPEVYTGDAEAGCFRFREICDLLTPDFAVWYKILANAEKFDNTV